MDQRGDGGGWGIELGFVFFGEFQVDGGEVDAVLEIFLFGFHLFDFAADTGDFLFDAKDVADFSGALGEDGLETLLGFGGVFQTGNQISMLLGDFFSVLVFGLGATEGFYLNERGGELRRGNAQGGLERTRGTLRRVDGKVGRVTVVASDDGVERCARGIEIFRDNGERDGAGDHWPAMEPALVNTFGGFMFGFCFAFKNLAYRPSRLVRGQAVAGSSLPLAAHFDMVLVSPFRAHLLFGSDQAGLVLGEVNGLNRQEVATAFCSCRRARTLAFSPWASVPTMRATQRRDGNAQEKIL